MSSNPKAFAQRVLDAFELAGRATDEEVGDAGGPSTTTLAKYRKVATGEMTMSEPRGDVLKRIDRAARWRGGSARALWREGREPDVLKPSSLEAPEMKPGRVVRAGGLEGYVEWLAERLSEVEERIDLLTATVHERTQQREDGERDERSAAKKMPEVGPADQPTTDDQIDAASDATAATISAALQAETTNPVEGKDTA